MNLIWTLVRAGLLALQEYIIYHTVTCLVAAFLLAGAVVSFVSKEAIIYYLGRAAGKVRSFTIAAVGSFVVAACSCTVIPVSAGLYYRGGAVGPAFIILWVAPAANILALVYTGAILGGQIVLVRLAAALVMAAIVGTVMSVVFSGSEARRQATAAAKPSGTLVSRGSLILSLLLVATLLAPNYLIRRGAFVYKLMVTLVGLAAVGLFAYWKKTPQELRRWLRETWWFVRVIMPLLLAGVFVVGVIARLIPQPWVQKWLSGSGLLASFLATMIGAVSYFATMTEAPFVDKLMGLGMGKGPALALLLTGPGISLPNWLAVARVFGWRKALVYVVTVIVLGTVTGWVVGNFVLPG
jgi:uncharacterized membrane protein YraQ (UPF0718 family)